MASLGKPDKKNPFINPPNQQLQFPPWPNTTTSASSNYSVSIGDTNFPVGTINPQYNIGSGWITGTSTPQVKVVTKQDAINIINAHINALAQKANRLARLREFFQSLNSNQQDLIKDFWETVKKELQS